MLTSEEIMKLEPGRKLDLLVAQHVTKLPSAGWYSYTLRSGYTAGVEKINSIPLYWPSDYAHHLIPPYSTEIASAYEMEATITSNESNIRCYGRYLSHMLKTAQGEKEYPPAGSGLSILAGRYEWQLAHLSPYLRCLAALHVFSPELNKSEVMQ